MKKLLAIMIISMFCTSFVFSYDNTSAHREFNMYILSKFKEDYKKWPEFKDYTFLLNFTTLKGPAITKSGWWSPTTTTESYTAEKWIIEGGYSADEPEVPAAYRHFYDPIANDGKTHLTDLNTALALFNPQIDAINWHFIGNDPTSANDWTWVLGKEYMVKAMQASVESERNEYLAKAFRCLGEVLHNTADMGCPPHVRNDAHGGMGLGGPDPYESTFNPGLISSNYKNEIGQSYKSIFEDAKTAIDINMELAKFTNKYFFSDETISGKGVETYTSRNGKKDYPNPKLDKLTYEADNFNYYSIMPSGRKIEMCNDQSILLGYLTQNFRSYPRVTKKNSSSQATELIPMIVEAGKQVVRRFFPLFRIEISINSKDKKLTGSVKHIPSSEYAGSISYNGKVGLKIDGQISNIHANCSKGSFEISEIDTKIPPNKKVQAFINFADITIVSDEITNEIVAPPTIDGVKNLSDKWQRNNVGFSGDTIKITGKFSGVNSINLKVKFIDKSGPVEASVISFNSTQIMAIVPFASSGDKNQPSWVKMYVEINSVRSEEQSFQIFNWWYRDFHKFKAFGSDVRAKINFDDGSNYDGDILDYKMNIAAFWETGTIEDKKYTDNSISFTWRGINEYGEAVIKVTVYFLNKGRSVNVDYDIQSTYLYLENESKKVEIKTKKIISIKGLDYYGVWSGHPTGSESYYDNPNYSENSSENSNIKDKLKIEKYEIQTIETDKKVNPPTQKVIQSNIQNIEKVTSLEVWIGNFNE